MKFRNLKKIKQFAIEFDQFQGSDEYYEVTVIRDGDKLTLHGHYEHDNGLYITNIPYEMPTTMKALKFNFENAPKRRCPPNTHSKSVWVYPYTGFCKYCKKDLPFNIENFDWGWAHRECEDENFAKFCGYEDLEG